MKAYALIADSEEQLAVITARTSRSPHTFDVIAAEVRERGHKQFIKDNVLGYGHDSVAEMAMCPAVAIEDISDIAANVVATSDPQLRVQMTSTRYQDMGSRRAYSSGGNVSARGTAMREFYMSIKPKIQKLLDDTDHPRKRTLECDIARAFLPAGISTQLAIRGDARVMRDAVAYMLGHELAEVRQTGEAVLFAVKPHIEVLFDRHTQAAPRATGSRQREMWEEFNSYLPGEARFIGDLWHYVDDDVRAELSAWRDSGWRRRMRIAESQHAQWFKAVICSDYGAYRDLRRNRTLAQDDLLPSSRRVPSDALWAFRQLYPVLCDDIDSTVRCAHNAPSNETDAYNAPMGAIMTWRAGGHPLNWAYALRLRSGVTCHPAYALPMRALMRQILGRAPWLAEAMGIVESPKSLLGVEFSDRVPT